MNRFTTEEGSKLMWNLLERAFSIALQNDATFAGYPLLCIWTKDHQFSAQFLQHKGIALDKVLETLGAMFAQLGADVYVASLIVRHEQLYRVSIADLEGLNIINELREQDIDGSYVDAEQTAANKKLRDDVLLKHFFASFCETMGNKLSAPPRIYPLPPSTPKIYLN